MQGLLELTEPSLMHRGRPWGRIVESLSLLMSQRTSMRWRLPMVGWRRARVFLRNIARDRTAELLECIGGEPHGRTAVVERIINETHSPTTPFDFLPL